MKLEKFGFFLIAFLMGTLIVFGQGQDSIRASGGVLTINLVPSSIRYKVFVDQTITSTVITNPIPGAVITVLFVQDSTGHTVAFGGNISGACTVASTASSTTGCQFTFDAANNQWTGIGGGGGGASSNTADGAISPLNFNGDFKVRYESDCTFNSTTTVVCPSGNFTSSDVGKIEFGTNACQPHGTCSLITSPVIVPQGTIATFVNATTVTVSIAATANCTPSSTNLCWFAWGKQDDTTAIASAQTAAWNSGPCLTLQLPAGAAFVSKGGLGSLGLSQGNSCTGATDFGQVGPELAGMGQGATVLIPLPSFDFTTCTNGANSVACFGGAGALRAHDFQINGLGQTLNGTTHANELFEINGVVTFWNANLCTGGSASNLRLHDWGLMSTNLIGFETVGTCDTSVMNVIAQDFGNNVCTINGGTTGNNISLTGLACFGGNNGPTLQVNISNGAIISSTGGFYGGCITGTCTDVAVALTGANGEFNSSGEVMFGSVAAQQNVLLINGANTSSFVNLWGDVLNMIVASGTSNVVQINGSSSGGILKAAQTQFLATTNSRTFQIVSGNAFFDIGGNTYVAGSVANSIAGNVFGAYSITGTPVTAAKLVLSAGWGTTAAWTVLTGNTQYVTGTLTASGTGQAANPTITYTFPTPFLAPPTGCFALQVGGTQAAIANPFTPSSVTATGATFTYNGTPGAGSTLLVQIECWSM